MGKMKEEAIGMFEGVIGLMLVVSIWGGLMEAFIFFGGMLAITSSLRVLRMSMEHKKKKVEAET